MFIYLNGDIYSMQSGDLMKCVITAGLAYDKQLFPKKSIVWE
jgi:hypothetical protein